MASKASKTEIAGPMQDNYSQVMPPKGKVKAFKKPAKRFGKGKK
jgi:hypothetical protein